MRLNLFARFTYTQETLIDLLAKGFRIGVYNARGVQWRDEGGSQERGLAATYRRWAQQLAFDYPYVGSVLEGIATTYDKEGEWHDSDAKVRKRLRC